MQLPDGRWVAERFSVWGTMALASIGELPQEQQERAITINLRKVLAKDVPARLRHGTSKELQRRQKEFATWAASVEELPEVEMPTVLNYQPGRVFDNWEPLLQIAELAGGKWPGLIRNAIDDAVSTERAPNPVERTLRGIKKAFDQASEQDGKEVDRLTTNRLLALMLSDADEEWSTERRGRPITAYWLRGALRHLIDPPGSQDWWAPENTPRKHQKFESGYLKAQFARAWETYLAEGAYYSGENTAQDEHTHDGCARSATSDTSGTSATDSGNAGVSETDARSRSEGGRLIGYRNAEEKSEQSQSRVVDALDVADVADASETIRAHSSATPSPQPTREHPKFSRRRPPAPTPGVTDAASAEPAMNGADPEPAPWVSRTDQVRAVLADHPDWDYRAVARELGQDAASIGTIFKSLGK